MGMNTKTQIPTQSLPFELGRPRSFRGLTLLPLFPVQPPAVEYIGLDEASARGLTVSEVGAEGVVEWLALENSLAECVLLYEARSSSVRSRTGSSSRRSSSALSRR